MDDAFLELLEQKDFEYITVTEICKKADVNRSTFYLHYETIGDLLSECLEGMNDHFFRYFQESMSEFKRKIEKAPLDQLFLITPNYLIPYLTYISEHRTGFKVVLAKPEIMGTDKTYASFFHEILNPILARYGIPENERDYFMSFYTAGVMGIISRWLQLDCQSSMEDITEIIMKVIRR
ncbi:MAG: TetR/AcrR family transcriptional regulator [Ruminococcus sp.]|nr:TetR/AcrR family transcriptional regulator [Ruminococcus sp.]